MVLVTERVECSPLAAGTALWHSQEAADSKSAAFWYLALLGKVMICQTAKKADFDFELAIKAFYNATQLVY